MTVSILGSQRRHSSGSFWNSCADSESSRQRAASRYPNDRRHHVVLDWKDGQWRIPDSDSQNSIRWRSVWNFDYIRTTSFSAFQYGVVVEERPKRLLDSAFNTSEEATGQTWNWSADAGCYRDGIFPKAACVMQESSGHVPAIFGVLVSYLGHCFILRLSCQHIELF